MENVSSSVTAESFLRSLAEQLAHQMGGTVEDFKIYKKNQEDETA